DFPCITGARPCSWSARRRWAESQSGAGSVGMIKRRAQAGRSQRRGRPVKVRTDRSSSTSQLSKTPATEATEQRLAALLRRWRAQPAYLSSSTQITGHAAYQEIISLGKAALPALFRDLEQTQDGHLSRALSALTGAHPIPPEERGQIREIAATWLRWAKENG